MDDFREPRGLTRRSLLAGAGALIVSFSLAPKLFAQGAVEPEGPALPGALNDTPLLDSWIRIDAQGKVTVFTGKAELGQGIKTALVQCAAEELEIEPGAISLISADTGATPNEGYTAGSMSTPNSATAIRNAAAQVREILINQAAQRLGVDAMSLRADAGAIIAGNGERLTYGELVADNLLHVEAAPVSKLKATQDFRVMGKPLQRLDIPPKVTGGAAYVQDMRLEGMLHGRVIRPPSYRARLREVDARAVREMPGVVAVVRDGSYLAVVAEQEFQAVKAMRMLARSAQWEEMPDLPDITRLPDDLKALPFQDGVVADSQTAPGSVAQTFEAHFTRPYQMHGSIGPSCAVGHFVDGVMTVWTHTQGVFPDRDAIAQMLNLDKSQVRCIHAEGSGCYGHNGADDAAADAALLAHAVPGRPIRVHYMREQEHAWEPYGPGMATHIKAGIDETGKITQWEYELWSNNHGTRPGSAGSLLSARYLASPFQLDPQKLSITPNGNGDRNADPGYALPHKHVIWHWMPDMPLRVSALRALGAYANVYSIESTMDELANMAEIDPVEFRLNHMEDPRGRDVITRAAEKFNWGSGRLPEGRGRGFAYARYKNHAAYLAIAVEIEVNVTTGRIRLVRANAAIDSGEIINPDGIRNQTEGGILQSASWTLYEGVTFDRTRITSIDWQTYPILRFAGVPDSIEIDIMDRPGEPFLGTGEAAQGPTGAAIANALKDATGARLYDLPLNPDKVLTALSQV